MLVPIDKIQYIDVAPSQMVGVSAGLIPFLEHDDANRALMGSNMQRQAVPLLVTEPPIVGTGLERDVALQLGHDRARRPQGHGHVRRRRRGSRSAAKCTSCASSSASTSGPARTRSRSSSVGDKVEKGQVIADGAATYQGELALGRNVLVAFMSWEGFNFEDAIIISEELVKNDTYTSIHIEEFDVEIRETKLGREEFTRDIPNVSEKVLRNLDENGIVRIGTLRRAGRHPGRQGLAEEQDRADAGREAAARDLRPGRRGREERFARSAVRRRRHRHRHAAVLPPHEPHGGRAQGVRAGR